MPCTPCMHTMRTPCAHCVHNVRSPWAHHAHTAHTPRMHTARAAQVITSIAIMMGVVFMAMPLQIVGGNFLHVWEDREKTRVVVRIQEHFIDRQLSVQCWEAIDAHGFPHA